MKIDYSKHIFVPDLSCEMPFICKGFKAGVVKQRRRNRFQSDALAIFVFGLINDSKSATINYTNDFVLLIGVLTKNNIARSEIHFKYSLRPRILHDDAFNYKTSSHG